MVSSVEWMERRQVLLYFVALAAGAALGFWLPAIAPALEFTVTPVLGLLLFATFLGVPFAVIGRAVRDWRFLAVLAAVNFVFVPAVVFAVSRFVAHDQALLVGVLFVLLTPCIDYVIVFAGIAGGAKDKLLAATPLLMLLQILLLPLYLRLFLGTGFVQTLDLAPFVQAFLLLIVLPLVLAGLTQFAAARTRMGTAAKAARTARAIETASSQAMVPLMMLTLTVVVASQVAQVGEHLGRLLTVIPVFALFVALMVPVGAVLGRIARLDVRSRRAVVFSGVTRNSLVVLPLVLALPVKFQLAPLVVVTQTLIELVCLVLLTRWIPALIREQAVAENPLL